MRRATPPPAAVLHAFGAEDPPTMLRGGMGGTWRSGDLVLKRSAEDPAWHEWEAHVLAAARTDHIRVQHLRAAHDGRHVVDGWIARDFLVGAHEPGRWPEIIDAGDALHAALAGTPDRLLRPPPVSRDHAWAVADRIAWGEIEVPAGRDFDDVDLTELLELRRPVSAPSQLVHGDLTGNVLFADGMVPGIIDFSPYLRPTAYAIGVVVADAVVWEGADLELLTTVADRPEMGQCLLRALIFRHVTSLLLPGHLPSGDATRRYARLRDAAITLAAR
jgi:uncharacterized protein (TIGR02569 family)